MHCENCGSEVSGNFCSNCGQPIKNPQLQPTAPVPMVKPIDQTPSAQPHAQTYQQPRPQYHSSEPKWAIPTVIIIVVVLILAIFFGVFLNPSNSPSKRVRDSDGDGTPDSEDEFPDDDSEDKDTDKDGVGDNADVFPNNPNETDDFDEDGVGDNADPFPNDPTQWADKDGDGYGDNPNGTNPDIFPDDTTEWKDTDSDNVGDNSDIYDEGNGGIYLDILEYNCNKKYLDEDEDGDALDPYFVIWIDANNNDEKDVDEISTSKVYENYTEISNPHSFIIDVPEDIDWISMSLSIFVYDNDSLSSDDVIDISSSPDETSINIIINSSTRPRERDNDHGGNDFIDDEDDAGISYEYGVREYI